jgi:hypothetical protein
MMQDQSQCENTMSFILDWAIQRVITIRPVLYIILLFLANEFNASDRLQVATFIVWRTAS